jgi:hypothetical protein
MVGLPSKHPMKVLNLLFRGRASTWNFFFFFLAGTVGEVLHCEIPVQGLLWEQWI